MKETDCAICGSRHVPIDRSLRYHCASSPDSPMHADELAWYRAHGVGTPRGMKFLEAFCYASEPAGADTHLRPVNRRP